MSRINDLRNNENNSVNLVKILELFCGGETKYVEMLLKLFRTSGDSTEIKVNAISFRTGIDVEKLKQLNGNEIEILFYMVDNMMLLDNISKFKKFCELNEEKQIENNDLHSYKNFEQVKESLSDAQEKIKLKELEKQINKIYEDDEWLLLIPLTYEASVKYGYNTKWCTASEKTDEQFKSYSRDGILIYVIHKGVEKIAVYKKYSSDDISFWNERDTKTDSFYFNFPPHIIQHIREAIQNYTKSLILDFDEDIFGGGDFLKTATIIDHMNLLTRSAPSAPLTGSTITWSGGTSNEEELNTFNDKEMASAIALGAMASAKTSGSYLSSPEFIRNVKNLMGKLR